MRQVLKYLLLGQILFLGQLLLLYQWITLYVRSWKIKKKDFQDFKVKCQKIGTTEEALANAEKLGFKTGIEVDHPFISNKKLPVYAANFVLMDYGTGAIFGCPAHDQRDFDFAKKYNLEIIKVVSDGKDSSLKEAFTEEGQIINSDFLNGLTVSKAKEKVIERLEKENLGSKKLPLD